MWCCQSTAFVLSDCQHCFALDRLFCRERKKPLFQLSSSWSFPPPLLLVGEISIPFDLTSGEGNIIIAATDCANWQLLIIITSFLCLAGHSGFVTRESRKCSSTALASPPTTLYSGTATLSLMDRSWSWLERTSVRDLYQGNNRYSVSGGQFNYSSILLWRN